MGLMSTAKRCVVYIADKLARNKFGSRLIDQLIMAGMSRQQNVEHVGVKMTFGIPNSLCSYRATSFASKEPETLLWLEEMPKGCIFWDIGANIGLYSIYAALKRDASVIAIEPSFFNLEMLARNIVNNRVEHRISIIPLAVSDTMGIKSFNMSNTAWGGALSTFGEEFDQSGHKFTPMIKYKTFGFTLDQMVFDLNLPQPNFIKIDVDGIEHLILSGAFQTLKNVKSVLVELDQSFSTQTAEATRYLDEAGFSLTNANDISDKRQSNQIWTRTKWYK